MDERPRIATAGSQGAGVSREIIDLAIKYVLMSRATSFVAVERRATPVVGEMALRRIPIALTSGWGGLQRRLLAAPGARLSSPSMLDTQSMLLGAPLGRDGAAAPAFARRMTFGAAGETGFLDKVKRFGGFGSDADDDVDVAELRAPQPRAGRPDRLQALIEMQRADGSWQLNGELVRVLGLVRDDIDAALIGAGGTEDDAKRALATALAICWLHENAADRRSEWRWLVEKAERWLAAAVPRPASGGSWTAVAQRLQAVKPSA